MLCLSGWLLRDRCRLLLAWDWRLRLACAGSLLLGLIVLALLQAVDLVFVDRVQRAVLRNCALAIHGLADFAVRGQAVQKVFGVPLHGRELGEPRVQVGLVEGFGMKLALEPAIQSHGAHGIHVAGLRAEGEPVQSVLNALIALQLCGFVCWADLRLGGGLVGGGLCLLRKAQGRGAGQGTAQQCGQWGFVTLS